MGGPLKFFLHTYATVLTYWHNWLDITVYEIGITLVVYEDVFISDLQCAMTRPVML